MKTVCNKAEGNVKIIRYNWFLYSFQSDGIEKKFDLTELVLSGFYCIMKIFLYELAKKIGSVCSKTNEVNGISD